MKVEELRIGNLVKTCIPNMEIMIPCIDLKVQGITIFSEIEFGHEPYSEGFKMPVKYITGIPLSEPLLRNAGFSGNDVLITDNIRVIISEDFEVSVVKDNTAIAVECKYIHQLQNLFFEFRCRVNPNLRS